MNTKKDTPMKRLSTHFQVMEQELRQYGAVKKCLNKAAPRSDLEYSENDKKGVFSDFIIIFNFGKYKPSISFVFNYLDESLGNTFNAQIKNGEGNDTIISSIPFEYEEFRGKLNSFNKYLTTPKKAPPKSSKKTELDYLFEVFNSTFMSDEMGIEFQETIESYKDRVNVKTKELKFSTAERKLNKAIDAYDLAVANAEKECSKIPEIEQIKALEESLRIARKKLEMKEEKIREKHEILKLKVEVNRAESSIKQKNKELEDFKTHALSSLPVVAKAIFGKKQK